MEAQIIFLTAENVELYSKKKQVDHLVESILSYIWKSEKNVTPPSDFFSSLKAAFMLLPEGQTIANIWSILNKELKEHYNNVNDIRVEKLELILELASSFIMNVSTADVPDRTARDITLQLRETIEYAISHIKATCLDQKCVDDGLAMLCHLLSACTSFMISLPEDSAVFRCLAPASEGTGYSEEFSDLSPVYPQLTTKQWKKIHRFIKKQNSRKLLINWEHLLIQVLRWCCCHMVDMRAIYSARQLKLCDYLILDKLESLDLNFASEWSGTLLSVTEENYVVAFWSLLCDNFFFLLPQTPGSTSPYDSTVAKVLLIALLSTSLESNNRLNLGLQSVTRMFISNWQSSGFSGLHSLHSCLLSNVLSKISELFRGNEKSKSKRMKGSKSLDTVQQLLTLTKDAPSNDKIMSVNGNVMWPSQETFELINKSFQSLDIDQGSNVRANMVKDIRALLQILKDILLPFLNVIDRTRLSLAILSILSVESSQLLLFEICLDIIHCVVFDGQGIQLLLHGVHADLLLHFISELLRYLDKQVNPSHLKDKLEKVFCLVLKEIFKRPGSIQQFNSFVSKNCLILTKVKKLKKDDSMLKEIQMPVSCLIICMESIYKVLHQAYICPDIEALLTKINRTLVSEFQQLLKEFCLLDFTSSSSGTKQHGDAAATVTDNLLSLLLSGCVCQLDEIQQNLNKKDKDKDTDSEKNAEEILNLIPILCQNCIQVLHAPKKYDAVYRCIQFIGCICSHLQLVSKYLPDSFLNSVWTVLFDMLQDELHSRIESCNNVIEPSSASAKKTSDKIKKKLIHVLVRTIATVTSVFDLDEFDRHMEFLLNNMKPCHMMSDSVRIEASLLIWQQMTEKSLAEDHLNSFYLSCQKLLIAMQVLLFSGGQISHLTAAILQTQTKFISLGPCFLEPAELSVCMNSVADVNLETIVDLDEFTDVFNELYSLSNALLLYQATFVHLTVPAFICIVKKLLRSVIHRCKQDGRTPCDLIHLNKLDHCSRLVYRLASLMGEHKVDFTKVAPYIVSEYVNEVQKVTLYPMIKKSLLLAVYKWLDICSSHGINYLRQGLPPGAKDIFRFLHEDFEKYHRYKGQS